MPRWSLLLMALMITFGMPCAGLAAAIDTITFVSPAVGSVYHVGDIMRIEYTQTGTVQLNNDWLAISANNGLTYADFKQIGKTRSDTTAILRHFDWVIPDSLLDLGGNVDKDIHSMVSDSCVLWIHTYAGAASTLVVGFSGQFSIKPRAQEIRWFPKGNVRDVSGSANSLRILGNNPGDLFLSIDGRIRSAISAGKVDNATKSGFGFMIIAGDNGTRRAARGWLIAR